VSAYLLLLLFGFAMSWIGALIGLSAPSVEVAQSAGLMWLFPLSFISSAFVGAGTMPGPLKAVAEWNPFTAVIQSVRDLFGNEAPLGMAPPAGWPADNAVLYALLSSLLILAVFVPLSVAKYRKVASK